MKQKIGIFGGTFNPPHLGHRRLVDGIADAFCLDCVLIMPTCIPPHKIAADLAEGEHRLAMCRLAFEDDPRYRVSTLELERGQKSYTVETLRQLAALYPEGEFYWMIGSDMLATFTQWYCWEEILERAYLCAASREEGYCPDLTPFSAEQQKKILFCDVPPLAMSSTALRKALAQGESTQQMLAANVQAYIRKENLYQERFSEYRRLIAGKLDAYRLTHSFCVANAARELALQYGADPDKAELAGLLHDVMKNASAAEQQSMIQRGGHTLTPCEQANPKVWHSMAGEAYLRLESGITDAEILSAVRYHTTGRAGMSLMEKIVFIADFISTDRTYPDVDKVRCLAKESLEQAILYTSAYTLCTLARQNRPIHPATVDCYNDAVISLQKG